MSKTIRILAIFLVTSILGIMIASCNSSADISASRYYYNQLNEIEQCLYLNMVSQKNEFIEGKKVELYRTNNIDEFQTTLDAYDRAFEAYIMDNPMASLWCNSKYVSFTIESIEVVQDEQKEYQYVLYLIPVEEKKTISPFDTSEQLQDAIADIEKTAHDFINTLEGTNHEKIRAIHDWLIEGAVYGENKHAQDVYSSIIKKEAICYGFSLGFKYLCDIAGINSINVLGDGHVWNYVQDDDGIWYLVDVTWDLDAELEYFLVDIKTEMASGRRKYNDFFNFSYKVFNKQ